MERTIYAYKIKPVCISDKKPLMINNIEKHLYDIVNNLCQKSLLDRKRDFTSDKKVLYLDKVKYEKKEHILKLKFVSLKYDSRRRVVDTKTFSDKGILKGETDGDEEKNHLCLKFIENNEIIALYEYNSSGIGFRRVMDYLQRYIRQHNANLRKKGEKINYKLFYENIVSNDFLKALADVKKVKAITLTVEQKDKSISEFKDLAGRGDIAPSVDILFKPAAPGLGIHKDTVKQFWKIYNNKERDVKRVTIDGAGLENQPIKFDTESMKQRFVVKVKETSDTHEVETTEMFNILYTEILNM